jgi:predicted AAA+ superfamily ATPase
MEKSMEKYTRPLYKTLLKRIVEPRGFIQVVAGPRQIGKTTLLEQLVAASPIRAFSYSVDDAPGAGADWLDYTWQRVRETMAQEGIDEALLVVDEVQNLLDWSAVVKKNWDSDSKTGLNLKVILSGSSRLLLQQGLTESLLGRFELSYLGHWSFMEMRDVFGMTAQQYAWFGGYPGAARFIEDEPRFKNYVRNSIIEPSISKDILMLTKVDKPALLRQLFELGTTYTAQILSFNKLLGRLQDAGNTTTLARYAQLLDQAGLLAQAEKYSEQPIRTRASTPKFQVHNQALFSALQTTTLQEAQLDGSYWGRVVESAIGSHLIALTRDTVNARLYYWRERDLEVDYVLKYGSRVLAIEVKSGKTTGAEYNLVEFKKRYPDAMTLLVGSAEMPWQRFLEMGIGDLGI